MKVKVDKNIYNHKLCNCPKEYWETIIVDKDENYDDNPTIYNHCDFCGIDWLITNYLDNSIIYYKHKK